MPQVIGNFVLHQTCASSILLTITLTSYMVINYSHIVTAIHIDITVTYELYCTPCYRKKKKKKKSLLNHHVPNNFS